MSWSYSGDPSNSPLDKCRFIIGDTRPTEPLMQDQEIQYLIDSYKDEDVLLYQLFSQAATIFARDVKRKLGPMTEDPTERLNYFKEQAAYYKGRMSCSGLSVPLYTSPKIFRKGMQNNPPNLNREGRYV